MTYQLTQGDTILRIPDGAFIPADPANTDYAAYLAWLAAGNEPEPAPDPATPPPAPDYWAFWEALIGSSVYAAIREQALTSLPMTVGATELITLLNDGKSGRPNPPAIQASMVGILTTGTFTASHLGELQAALAAGNLTEVYTLPGG
jgi:hypothetical protein